MAIHFKILLLNTFPLSLVSPYEFLHMEWIPFPIPTFPQCMVRKIYFGSKVYPKQCKLYCSWAEVLWPELKTTAVQMFSVLLQLPKYSKD